MRRPHGLVEWVVTIVFMIVAAYLIWHLAIPFILGVIRQALALIVVALVVIAAIVYFIRGWLQRIGLWPTQQK